MLFSSVKDPKGQWGSAIPLHEQINRDCEHACKVAIDGRSLYFSSVDPVTYKEGYNIYFTQEILKDNWLIPKKISEVVPDETKILPQFVNGNIYYLKRTVIKKQPFGSIFKIAAPENALPFKVITTKGKILSQADKKPLEAELTVFDPTTLKILGVFKSDKTSGEYELPLLDGKNYIVDIRKQGYSFASFQLDYRQEEKVLSPEKTELFQNIELVLSVYDNEIFRPLEAEVLAESTTDKGKKFEGKMISPGSFSFTIPMGEAYKITAKANWFDENTFEFNLNGDIVFSKFERFLPLSPRKKPFEIKISDKDTEEGLVAEVMITNLNREETIFFSAQDVKDGKITAMLREGDQYEFTIRGAQGYSFHNQVVDFAKEDTRSLSAELVSLKAKTSIRLNNINFGSNSAELSAESFPELNRVVQLIKDNPNIVIEIAAHTDNVGSPSYNLILSEKRAQSVVNYLLDNAVSTERLVAKGYGLRKPMVPNTSDENKALNRRVEFNILDILSDAQ
jgi:outer membrane protein OmpA-like peptidoglycan-associated protein